LLKARGKLMRRYSYFNLALADSLSRVVYVNLTLRLADKDKAAQPFAVVVNALAEFVPDFGKFAEMCKRERKAFSLPDPVPHDDSGKLIEALFKAFGDEYLGVTLIPTSAGNLVIPELLKTQDLCAIACLLSLSAFDVQAQIPAFFDYRIKAKDFSVDDSLEKIQFTMGEAAKVRPSAVESFLRTEDIRLEPNFALKPSRFASAPEAVSRLLKEVRRPMYRFKILLETYSQMSERPRREN
jgi:hypothetical protein